MGYTVRQLAKLAGISPRTIRYYDEIDLLKPARVSAAGYRLYGRAAWGGGVSTRRNPDLYRDVSMKMRLSSFPEDSLF